jgi:hypothetical protein
MDTVRARRLLILLEIKPTQKWKEFNKIFGKEIHLRYQWFLYEFGKRVTRTFLKHLKTEIGTIQGTKEYKKSLILAEIRDKGKRSWFAVTALASALEGDEDPNEIVLEVVARFKKAKDPTFAILEKLGPWTVDTIPFLPSDRQGQIVLKKKTPKEVQAIRDANFEAGSVTEGKMVTFGINFTPRDKVYSELRVVRDLEVEALALEFGMAINSKPHWRPSLRWLKRNVIRQIMREKDMFRVWYDPTFRKYRVRRTLKVKLNIKDLKRIKEFQDKVRI